MRGISILKCELTRRVGDPAQLHQLALGHVAQGWGHPLPVVTGATPPPGAVLTCKTSGGCIGSRTFLSFARARTPLCGSLSGRRLVDPKRRAATKFSRNSPVSGARTLNQHKPASFSNAGPGTQRLVSLLGCDEATDSERHLEPCSRNRGMRLPR